MDELLKRKLLNLEVDPPEKMWDKISAALDEEVTAEFPLQLHDLELQPPLNTWSSIASALTYSEKLYNLEIEPPVSAWQNIAAAIEEKPVRRIIPIRRIPVWKYVAAASIFAVISFSVKWLTAEKAKPEIANRNIPAKKNEQQKTEVANQQTENTTSNDEPNVALSNNLPKEGPREANTAPLASSKNFSRRNNNYMTAAYRIPKTSFATDEFCMKSLQTNIPGCEPRVPESAYRYLLFENDNCELIRMSKKLAEKLGCTAADANTPEYQNCLQQLKKWSEKIAQMNITPSPDNFMNIFELLKSTEDKQF